MLGVFTERRGKGTGSLGRERYMRLCERWVRGKVVWGNGESTICQILEGHGQDRGCCMVFL